MPQMLLSRIHPRADQPREHFDEGKLQELADSIAQFGVRQAIEVRPCGCDQIDHPKGHYEIVMGERRWRASHIAEQRTIPTTIAEYESDLDAFIAATTENVVRADMTTVEEARAYQRVIDEGDMTRDEVAALYGKTPAYVGYRLDLLGLVDEEMLRWADNGTISRDVAWYTARLSPDGQAEMKRKLGQFDSDREAVRHARAIYDREQQGELFTDDSSEEEREQRRQRRKSVEGRLERLLRLMGQALEDLDDVDAREVARVMGESAQLWSDRLKVGEQSLRSARIKLADAAALHRAGDGVTERVAA